MTHSMPLELSDALIERMIVDRARGDAPVDLVTGIMSEVSTTRQRSRLLAPLATPRLTGVRVVLIAAAIAAGAIGVAASIFGGPWNNSVLPPDSTPAPSVQAVPSASASASASAAPSPGASAATSPSLSGGGELIVYQFGASAIDLFTLDPATGQRTALGNLQKQTGPSGQSIHWSADRKHAVVFGDSDSVLAIVDVEARTVDALTGVSPSPSRDNLSPTGDRLARIGGNNAFVQVVDLQGNEIARTPLPAGLEPFLSVSWAPDGSSVLVSGCLPCSKEASSASNVGHLYVAPFDGSPVREITHAEGDAFFSAEWSPDMSAIAYTDAGGVEVYTVSDGRTTRLPGGARVNSPAWSPDGRHVAFARVGPDAGIYTVRPDGSGLTQVTSAGADPQGDLTPHWSPDGSWLLFTRGTTDASLGDLWIVPSAGGRARLLERNAVADW